MNAPEDPRIWQGIRTHLDELGSVAAVPPIGLVLDRPRSRPSFRTVTGLAGAAGMLLALGLLLPGWLGVKAPITGATPTSSSAPATSPGPSASALEPTVTCQTWVSNHTPNPSGIQITLTCENAVAAAKAVVGPDPAVTSIDFKFGRWCPAGRPCLMMWVLNGGYVTFHREGPLPDLVVIVGANQAGKVTASDAYPAPPPSSAPEQDRGPSSTDAVPAASAPTVSEDVLDRERRLLPTLDLLSELPGFQVGGLALQGDEVFVHWNGEFGPEAQAIVEDANRRGIVVKVIPVPYSIDELHEMAARLGQALAAKGIDIGGWRLGDPVDEIVMWGTELDQSAELRRRAEDIAADVLPPDLKLVIVGSPGF
jgi:hypothetical protein